MTNDLFKAGTLVCANYRNFKGELKPGVFLVIYDEALDSQHQFKNNICALKCTTSSSIIGNYTVTLSDGNNPDVERDTIVACSKIHTLDKSQIFRTICVIHPVTFKSVYKVYKKFNNEILREMEDYLWWLKKNWKIFLN